MRTLLAVASLLATTAAAAFGQAASGHDHTLVLEAGAVAQREMSAGPVGWGAGLAAEFAPVEGGLEYELGLSEVTTAGVREWSVDAMAMKSWQVAPAVELMVGLGPELAWHPGGSSLSAQAVVHVMYWPLARIGLFAEPCVCIQPTRNGERSVGFSAGLLVPAF